MSAKIIHIDEEKCDGCGMCIKACHEAAIAIVNGRAQLLREDYCDGLGDCLPACPRDAITIVERKTQREDLPGGQGGRAGACGCAGAQPKQLHPAPADQEEAPPSQLSQWPVQIKLAPVRALYFQRANLLIAADCTAFAYAGFHQRFLRGRIALVGCPKLDSVDYTEKLTEVLRENDIRSVMVVRMEVPCCGGLVQAVQGALQQCGKEIPLEVETISIDGQCR